MIRKSAYQSVAAAILLLLVTVRSAPAQTVAYEKVLFPVNITLEPVKGAFGSVWVTEVTVTNASPDTPVQLGGTYECFFCRTPFPLRPNTTYTALPVSSNEVPGSFLHVPQSQVGLLSYSVRIRDTTRGDANWGTDIPVVRERDFGDGHIELLNVPVNPSFRPRLRIYTLVPDEVPIAVRIYSQPEHANNFRVPGPDLDRDSDLLLSSTTLTTRTQTGSTFRDGFPGYAETDTLPGGDYKGSSLRVEVVAPDPSVKIWAFITITNNLTQAVTVVSPH